MTAGSSKDGRTNVSPWSQVLTMNEATINRIHQLHFKPNGPLYWDSSHSLGEYLTGTQKHHGHVSFNPDPNVLPVRSVVGYTFVLTSGIIRLQSPLKDMNFTKWTFLVRLLPAKSANYEKVDNGIYYYGIDLKIDSRNDSLCKIQFAPGATQDPDPALVEKEAGWAPGSINKYLERWFIKGLNCPESIILGLSIGCKSRESGPGYFLTPWDFFPMATMEGDPSKSTSASTPCNFAVYVEAQDKKTGGYDVLKGKIFDLKGTTAKLTIGYERFWNDWFHKALRPMLKALELYPPGYAPPYMDGYRIGFNPDHPNIDDKYYDIHDYDIGVDYSSGWSSEIGFGTEPWWTATAVSMYANTLESRIHLCFHWTFGTPQWKYLDNWEVYAEVTYGVTQFSSETGGITIEQDGDITYRTIPSVNFKHYFITSAVAELQNDVKTKLPGMLNGFLESLQTIDKFYDLGFDRFHAVNPIFASGNLVIDMNINGVGENGEPVRQKPITSSPPEEAAAIHKRIRDHMRELRKEGKYPGQEKATGSLDGNKSDVRLT